MNLVIFSAHNTICSDFQIKIPHNFNYVVNSTDLNLWCKVGENPVK